VTFPLLLRRHTLGPPPVHLDALPRVRAVLLLDLLARPEPPLGDPDHEAALEHEGAASGADELGLEPGDVPGALVAGRVGAVPAHDVVQARAARAESALAGLLGVVHAPDQAHELGHGVAVVPRRAEGVLGHEPAGREDDKVGDRRARAVRHRGEHGEDARVRVVERDAPDGVEPAQVVLVWEVVAVPGDHVKGRVRLLRVEQGVVELARDPVLVGPVGGRAGAVVLGEAGEGRLEVARVGEAVGPDGPQLRQRKVALVQLQRVPPDRVVAGQGHLELDAARHDADLHRPDQQVSQLGADVEHALLGDEQQVAVGRVEGLVGGHRLARGEDEDAYP